MPVQLARLPAYLTQAAYDQAISRHGQYVRWLRAQPCFCVSNGSIDPTCTTCKGRGFLYSHQTTVQVYRENSPHNLSEVAPKNTPIVSVGAVRYGLTSDEYTIVSNTTTEVLISPTATRTLLPKYYEPISVDYVYSRVKTFAGSATYLSGGTFEAALPSVRTKNGQSITGEITAVTSLQNTTKGVTYTVSETARNEMYVTFARPQDEPASGDVLTVFCTYVEPLTGLLTGVSQKMLWNDAYVVTGGLAMLTVSYAYYLGTGDLITQMAGVQRGEALMQRTYSDIDELPAFDVHSILKVIDSGREYVNGTDYQKWGRNQLKWISASKPQGTYSVLFLYHPTFSVMADKPVLRTGENQVFPRRVGLQNFDKVSPQHDATVPLR